MSELDLPLWLPKWVAFLITALGGLGVGGYTVARVLQRDRTNDSIDAKTQMLIDNQAKELARAQEEKVALGKKLDELAAERNEAVRTLGKLEGQVHALQQLIEQLKREVERLLDDNRALKADNHALKEANQALMSEMIATRTELAALREEVTRAAK